MRRMEHTHSTGNYWWGVYEQSIFKEVCSPQRGPSLLAGNMWRRRRAQSITVDPKAVGYVSIILFSGSTPSTLFWFVPERVIIARAPTPHPSLHCEGVSFRSLPFGLSNIPSNNITTALLLCVGVIYVCVCVCVSVCVCVCACDLCV